MRCISSLRRRASRELEEKAFAVLEQGWSYDVKFKLGQPPQKAKKAEEGTVSNV